MDHPHPTHMILWIHEEVCHHPYPLRMLASTTLLLLSLGFSVDLFITLLGASRFATLFDLKLAFALGLGPGTVLFAEPMSFLNTGSLVLAPLGGVLLAELLRYLWWHALVWALGVSLGPMARHQMRMCAHENPRSPWMWRSGRVVVVGGRGREEGVGRGGRA
ncbi:hypothetical protein BU16DRAFT_565458 [Lophium mytilinum]|uniref:Uncharacterized protein n=1 Tax=Lophium mytilinum TaxID=390894 RepID=A0A6A6QHR6_9PEZI|nr:hypothetical protein BU16DRAFT_565458 [Lophium mytilinum]